MAGEVRETVYGEFAADFVEDRLVELCDPNAGIQTGPFGSQLHQEDYVAVGTPIITVEHLGENRIIHERMPRVSDADRDRLSRYSLHAGDIVFSRVGSVDRRALVRSTEDGWLFSGRCLRVRPNPSRIDSGFLSYFFGLPAFKKHIRAIAVGATMPSLNTSILSDVVVPHPREITEQHAIAHILGTLDDKIELNRRMNETLEAISRALFESWFVDFDPVHAKAEGRDPGLPKPIADLFPDSFEDSELGEIPKGWKVMPVGSALTAVGGGTPSTKERTYWEGGKHHWATPKDLSTLSAPILLDTERKITDEGLSQISSGLLPIGTVLMSSRAPVGYLAISAVSVAVNQGFIAMTCDRSVSNYYALNWCHFNMDDIRQRASGTTFAEISKAAFRPMPMIVPTAQTMDDFSNAVRPFYDLIESNLREARTLAAIRDTLLPKLINGEIPVKDAGRFIRRVV
jgi:type I restriction enzyme S subunit